MVHGGILGLVIARGPRRQCWNFSSLDPRISTTRLLFFCAHKKGFSNFDLLAFLFDSLGRSDAYLHFSPVILQSFQISYPPTTPPSLQYYHPCLYSSFLLAFTHRHRWWMGFSVFSIRMVYAFQRVPTTAANIIFEYSFSSVYVYI